MENQEYKMNMRVLKKSNKNPMPGDIFVFQLNNSKYMYGKVIRNDASLPPIKDMYLVYIYSATSPDKTIPTLQKKELLIPPVVINKRLWTMGYFEKVGHKDLEKDEMFSTHCFEKVHPIDSSKISYVNEYGEKIPKKISPCGSYGLVGFMGLDKMIVAAINNNS